MCNYHTWFHNDKSGYVIECIQCNKIQVCFGNLLLSFRQQTFENFRRYVEKNAATVRPDSQRHIKSLLLTTSCQGINMILSESELEGLYQMLEYADNEMKTAALMKMFDEPQ